MDGPRAGLRKRCSAVFGGEEGRELSEPFEMHQNEARLVLEEIFDGLSLLHPMSYRIRLLDLLFVRRLLDQSRRIEVLRM